MLRLKPWIVPALATLAAASHACSAGESGATVLRPSAQDAGTAGASGDGGQGGSSAGGSPGFGGSKAGGSAGADAAVEAQAGSGGNAGSAGSAGGGGACTDSPVIEILFGNGAGVIAGNWSSAELAVVATCGGKPLASQAVHWAVTQGDGVMSETASSSPAKTWDGTTGPDGISKAVFRQPSGMSQPAISNQPGAVKASASFGSADFIVTVFNPGPSVLMPSAMIVKPVYGGNGANLGSGKAGTTMPAALQVQVANVYGDKAGQGVPNIGIRIVNGSAEPLYCTGPSHTPLTGPDGIATCDLQLPSQPGQVNFDVNVGAFVLFQDLIATATP